MANIADGGEDIGRITIKIRFADLEHAGEQRQPRREAVADPAVDLFRKTCWQRLAAVDGILRRDARLLEPTREAAVERQLIRREKRDSGVVEPRAAGGACEREVGLSHVARVERLLHTEADITDVAPITDV